MDPSKCDALVETVIHYLGFGPCQSQNEKRFAGTEIASGPRIAESGLARNNPRRMKRNRVPTHQLHGGATMK